MRLAALIYALTGPTMAGILIIACLASGLDTLGPIVIAAVIGFVGAMPVAWIIARRISQPRR
jgi:predicted PurR-regulated permease PerM